MAYVSHLFGVILPQLVAVAAIQMVYRRGGLIALHFGAVMGTGAYTYALLAAEGHTGLVTALPLGALAAALTAFLLYPALAGGGRRFILLSLSLQLIFTAACRASAAVGGEGGMRGLPAPTLAGGVLSVGSITLLLPLAAACVALIGILFRLERSSLDLKLRAAADDSGLVEDLGLSSRYIRLAVLGISCAATGAAGVLSTAYRGGASPDDYGLGLSILVLSAAALAWDRSLTASLITGVFLSISAEALRASGVDPDVEKIFYGLVIVAAVGRAKSYG